MLTSRLELTSEMPIQIHSFQQQFEAQLTKWILSSQNSFSSVDSEHFVVLINICNPRLKVPSKMTIQRRVIAQCEDKTVNVRTKLYKRQGRVSMSAYVWSSHLYRVYMVVTGHWIDQDWIMRSVIL